MSAVLSLADPQLLHILRVIPEQMLLGDTSILPPDNGRHGHLDLLACRRNRLSIRECHWLREGRLHDSCCDGPLSGAERNRMRSDSGVWRVVKQTVDIGHVRLDAFSCSPVWKYHLHSRAMNLSKQLHVFPLTIRLKVELIESLQIGLNLIVLSFL